MFKIPRATRKRLNFRKPTTDACVLGGLSKFRAFRPGSVLQTRCPFPFFFIYFIKDRMSGFKLVEPSVLSFLVLKLFFTGERCFQPKFKYLNLPSSPFFCLKFQFKEVRSPYSVLVNTRTLVPFFFYLFLLKPSLSRIRRVVHYYYVQNI